MIPAVCAWLNATLPEARATSLLGGVVLGIDREPSAKVTLLLFSADGPAVVAKVGRRKTTEPALLAEHAALRRLRPLSAGRERPDLPRPLALDRVGGRLVLASTVVQGTALSVGYYRPGHVRRPDAVAGDLDAAGAWLAGFQRDTSTGQTVLGPDTYAAWFRPVLDRYRATVGWSLWEEALAARCAELCAELAGVPVPLVTVHGDYAIGNVLVTRDRVTGVIDWELSRHGGSPLTDVLKLVASYGSFLDRAAPPRRGAVPGHPGWTDAVRLWGGDGVWPNKVGLLHAFRGSGWFPDLVRSYLRAHLDRLGLPAESLELFLPLFLLEQATTLDDGTYRQGYRSVLQELWATPDRRWSTAVAGAR